MAVKQLTKFVNSKSIKRLIKHMQRADSIAHATCKPKRFLIVREYSRCLESF